MSLCLSLSVRAAWRAAKLSPSCPRRGRQPGSPGARGSIRTTEDGANGLLSTELASEKLIDVPSDQRGLRGAAGPGGGLGDGKSGRDADDRLDRLSRGAFEDLHEERVPVDPDPQDPRCCIRSLLLGDG